MIRKSFMPIHYNYRARRHLKKLLKQSDKSLTLNTLYHEIKALLSQYDENCEISYAAQMSFLKSLFEKISSFYDEQVYQHKSFWRKFLYFIGWLNTEESKVISLIKQIASRIKRLEAKSPLNFFDNLFYLSLKKKFDETCPNDNIKYLSHRSLTRFKDVPDNLGGYARYIAFKDYIKDLQHFQKTLQSNTEGKKLINKLILQLQGCQNDAKALKLHFQFCEDENTEKIKLLYEQFVQDNIFKIFDKILKLEIEETALFIHGFNTKEGSHASLYEVEKVGQEQVVFRFINTGAGINQVNKVMNGGSSAGSSQSSIKVTCPIAIDTLITSNLIPQLIRPYIVESHDIKTGVNEMIAPILELYHQKQLFNDTRQVRHQSMGSCSQSSIDAWLETQLDEATLTDFHIYRLNAVLNQIESLLKLDRLGIKEREHYERMRIAASVELELLKIKLEAANCVLKKDKEEAIQTLTLVRKENSAYKGREPKPIFLEQYISDKLSPTRFQHITDVAEKKTIKETLPSRPVDVKTRKIDQDILYQLTFGFWGAKTETALTEEERRINKRNKQSLAQKIRNTQSAIHECTKMRHAIRTGFFTKKEQERIRLLTGQIMCNRSVSYHYLNPKILPP